jgi:helicase
MLSRRVRWGSPAEALDIIRVAERHGVPGFGRQRAMALLAQGLATFEDILTSAKEKLIEILRSEPRTMSLLAALHNAIGASSSRLAKTHAFVAKELGLEKIVADCGVKLGNEYEIAIMTLLKVELSWTVTAIDSGKRQNVPDILIKLNDLQIILECKTCTKEPALIKKEEAFAVLQKASDFDPRMRRVTLGKPAVDEHSKLKAQGSPDITLVEHSTFMEGILRVHSGKTTPVEFLKWLGTSGVTELDRLPGKATYLK